MPQEVRVRFAPSPTGFFHIGSARTALFNWLYARHMGGTFILRIEDTDKERNTPKALEALLHGMRWLGLNWDEGPEAGGSFGPYFQSQRNQIYQEYLQKLRDSGKAYDKDGAVWLKVSGETQVIEDAIRGRVERKEEKDFVIVRSNGMPVFHFVNVVDDITMQISHVIRGEDHLSNTSKHIELMKALEATIPTYAHIPLILKSSGPGKMSKRDEGALVEEYEKKHFLSQAVRNYLCLLGWSPKEDREILDIAQIIELFDLKGINKNNARFDEQKLAHINAVYLKNLSVQNLAWLARPILTQAGVFPQDGNEDYLQKILALVQEKIRSLESLPQFVAYFFTENFTFDPTAKQKLFKKGQPLKRLEEFLESIHTLPDFKAEHLEKLVHALCEKYGTKTTDYIMAARFAITGQTVGPLFYPLLETLGKKRVVARLQNFLELNK